MRSFQVSRKSQPPTRKNTFETDLGSWWATSSYVVSYQHIVVRRKAKGERRKAKGESMGQRKISHKTESKEAVTRVTTANFYKQDKLNTMIDHQPHHPSHDLMDVPKKSLRPVKSESQLSELSADLTLATEASETTFDSDRRVSFGDVQVREYERVVGDHPDTRIGVPLSISWAYVDQETLPIDKYEAERTPKGNLRMSSITRKNILHNTFGIPEAELRSAEKEVQKIKKNREKTNRQGKLGAKSESVFKGFRKGVKKVLNAEGFIKGISAVASNGMLMTMSPY